MSSETQYILCMENNVNIVFDTSPILSLKEIAADHVFEAIKEMLIKVWILSVCILNCVLFLQGNDYIREWIRLKDSSSRAPKEVDHSQEKQKQQ